MNLSKELENRIKSFLAKIKNNDHNIDLSKESNLLAEIINEYRKRGISKKEAITALVNCNEKEYDKYKEEIIIMVDEKIHYEEGQFKGIEW